MGYPQPRLRGLLRLLSNFISISRIIMVCQQIFFVPESYFNFRGYLLRTKLLDHMIHKLHGEQRPKITGSKSTDFCFLVLSQRPSGKFLSFQLKSQWAFFSRIDSCMFGLPSRTLLTENGLWKLLFPKNSFKTWPAIVVPDFILSFQITQASLI